MGGGEYIRYTIMIYLENLDFHPFQHSTRFVGGRKWKSNFFGRHLCHWGILEGAWKEISSGLKPLKHRRRQKLPIAPLSSSRFPPFPWKLKTKLGTPELQNSFNNVLPRPPSSPVLHFRCTHVAEKVNFGRTCNDLCTIAAFWKFSPQLIGGLCALIGVFILALPVPIVVNRWPPTKQPSPHWSIN